ncbi:hypothetical protein DSLASN_37830 [Desulfoluna limicola]|uniref:Uncharacterized protein n=1 Tax=Desulfoluna limicola TaxID=2810562 RepID=A0ABM7PLS5_9BACT|nr:hypothetical protein DSLASN_37830 [Desulfoluna limicola]
MTHITRRRTQGLPRPALPSAPLAAGGSQVKNGSGGPAGSQTFEKFDKQAVGFTLGLTRHAS